MIFKDISKFYNVKDYLPIINGTLNADLIIIFLSQHGIFKSYYLNKWYEKYQISAVLADVLILIIGIILARFFYKYIFTNQEFSIWKFTGLALIIQIIHDILFYYFFTSIPNGYNSMFDFFKKYAEEVGFRAILGDSFMMILACLFSSHFSTHSVNSNIIILITSLYFVPYMINYN
jgi:uncharacterized protein YacL